MKKPAVFLLLFCVLTAADAQRFIQFTPPLAGPRRVLRYAYGDEITLKLKDPMADSSGGYVGFDTGYITQIQDSFFYVNGGRVRPREVESIRVYRKKGRAIIPRALGWGAQLYAAVRIINSLINHNDPIITPVEIGITGTLAAAYYVYEFGINTRQRTYKVTKKNPIKIIILGR
jgi:hypothetical protein